MSRNRKLLTFILSLTMALTITSQVPAFALENEEPAVDPEQVTDQVDEPSNGEDEEQGNEQSLEEIVEGTEEQTDEQIQENTSVYSAGSTERLVSETGLTQVASPTSARWDGKTIDISWYNPEETVFEIDTGAKLAGLAAIVNGSFDGTITRYAGDPEQLAYIENVVLQNYMFVGAGGGDVGGTCYKATGNHDFMGKTVCITRDIDMTAGNYMPIGGKYPMCDADGSMYVNNKGGTGDAHVIEAYFNGVLDCEGHTIRISCDRYTNSGFPYSMAVGLVGYLGDVIDEDEVEDYPDDLTEQTMQEGWVPAVKDVSLQGDVYARRMVGGIIGWIGDAEYGVHIENCANHADVSSTDAKGCGGIVGAGWGSGKIINCYNTGTIKATYGDCACGGICAGNDGLDIYNCYNVGTIKGNDRGRGIGGHDAGSYTVANCYTLRGCDTDPGSNGWYRGTATDISVDIDVLDAAAMKDGSLAGKLNQNGSAYAEDEDGTINDGYPVLFFETDDYTVPASYHVAIDDNVENGAVGGMIDSDQFTEGNLAQGTIVYLTGESVPGCVLDSFTLNDRELTADFYTVSEDAFISARCVELRTGEIRITAADSKDCTVSVVKKGLVRKSDDSIEPVSNRKVINGDIVFQKDILTASANLHQDAYPRNKSWEYNGEFTYTFKYVRNIGAEDETIVKETTNMTGRFVVSADIENAVLIVTATPQETPKSWLSHGSTAWYYDSDSDDTFEVCSAEDLAGLAYLVNIEGVSFKGKTISIPENHTISLRCHDGSGGEILWPGIGINGRNSFEGVFDGNGNTILSMKVRSEDSSDLALFGFIKGAQIKNLTVRGESTAKGCAAGIVANSENSIISKCINYVDVESLEYDKAGGICGSIQNTEIQDCINRGTVKGVSGLGGIAGVENDEKCKLTRCSNYGTIKSIQYDTFTGTLSGTAGVGGIAGWNLGTIYGCMNKGSIESTDRYTGGIAGFCARSGSTSSSRIKVTSSFNNGAVTTKARNTECYAGGILGYSRNIEFSNVYNTGTVSSVDTSKAKLGSMIGMYYSDIFSSVSKSYWKSGTASRGYNFSSEADPELAVTKMTDADMKVAAFASKLAAADSSAGFVAVSSGYPTFSRIKSGTGIEAICKVTFTGAINGTVEVNKSGSLELPEAGEWEKYVFTANGKAWSGENIMTSLTVDVVKETDASYQAIFMANGETVGTAEYDQNTIRDVTAPDIPDSDLYSRKGYAVTWPAGYELRTDGDTVIRAVYYPPETSLVVQDDARIDTDGTWYLGGKSSGTITVAGGKDVCLIGENSTYSNLQIIMESGSKLTINNLKIAFAGDSVLKMGDDCELCLEGKNNSIEGIDTGSKVCIPAIQILGAARITGDGTLNATSESGDTVIDIEDGASLTQEDATLKLQKSSKIGYFKGGLINAGGHHGIEGTGIYEIKNGTLYCAANSDNMHAVKVGTFKMSGGDALVTANDEAKALVANEILVTEGNLKVIAFDYDPNETNKDPDHITVRNYNADAIDCNSFVTSQHVCKVDSSSVPKPYLVKLNGVKKYEGNGLGLEFDYVSCKFVKTADHNLYLWDAADSPDADIVNANMDPDNPDHVRGYSVEQSGNTLRVSMTGTIKYNKNWHVAAATYDASGNMLEYKHDRIRNAPEFDFNTLSAAHHYKVFVLEDLNTLIPAMQSYTHTL